MEGEERGWGERVEERTRIGRIVRQENREGRGSRSVTEGEREGVNNVGEGERGEWR